MWFRHCHRWYSRSSCRTSPPVRESLAGGTSNGLIGPVLIVNAKRDAIAVAEIKLCQIAVQMLLGTVLITTHE